MQAILYVAPDGDDRNEGTIEAPLATWAKARQAVKTVKSAADVPVSVYFRAGVYELPDTLVFDESDSGAVHAPVVYRAYEDEDVIVSGGTTLKLHWEHYRDGIMQARLQQPVAADQLFVNGERQPMARYPNYNPGETVLNGHSADCIAPERVKRWSKPEGGYVHALHKHGWGGFHYRIAGKDDQGGLQLEGGWQNNRQLGMHDRYRFVEHIFEELDAPGEWYMDAENGMLYLYPPAGVNLNEAHIEAVRLRHLVEFRGSAGAPVAHVHMEGMTFRRTARTFMETREPLLRSDWAMYRGGAVVFAGAEHCTLASCFFDQVGGNAIIASGYNRHIAVKECRIEGAGASGVSFVGLPSAVRSPLFEYAERQRYDDLDLEAGPLTDDYPADCLVEDCLITRCGVVEKQSAGVQISMAQSITVRHCTIYDLPRAGINVSEGAWGGHTVEFCDVFETVKETSDHGAFNSWGRDRYWGLLDLDLNGLNEGGEEIAAVVPLFEPHDRQTQVSDPVHGWRSPLPLLDAVKPNVLHHNRWSTERGWDIDLDDGSSHYRITNNLCLRGGIKLREGFYRLCENNVTVGNTIHPHVWYRGSLDVIRRNIVFEPFKPVRVPQPWGRQCDFNLLHRPDSAGPEPAEQLRQLSMRDEHSLAADASFVDPERGNYRVSPDSPALSLGFVNFDMDRFGTRSARLKRLARSPALPRRQSAEAGQTGRDDAVWTWKGAVLKNVVGLGEVSAYGLPEETGVIVTEIAPGGEAKGSGLQERDVIVLFNGDKVDRIADIRRWSGIFPCTLGVIRDQRLVTVFFPGSVG